MPRDIGGGSSVDAVEDEDEEPARPVGAELELRAMSALRDGPVTGLTERGGPSGRARRRSQACS